MLLRAECDRKCEVWALKLRPLSSQQLQIMGSAGYALKHSTSQAKNLLPLTPSIFCVSPFSSRFLSFAGHQLSRRFCARRIVSRLTAASSSMSSSQQPTSPSTDTSLIQIWTSPAAESTDGAPCGGAVEHDERLASMTTSLG